MSATVRFMNQETLKRADEVFHVVAKAQITPSALPSSPATVTQEAPEGATTHLASLDVLRATAALMVFCYHCTTELGSKLSTPFKATLTSGNLGVQLFFALSGYLIYATLDKSGRRNGFTMVWAIQFWTKRIFRIYPLYLVSILAVLVLSPDLWKWTTSENLVTHALGIHSLVRNHHGAINGSLWTLSLEIQFYLVAPVVYLAVRKMSSRGLACAALAMWMVSYGVCRFILIDRLKLWSPGGNPDSWSYFIGLNQLPSVSIFFVMGFLAYRLRTAVLSPLVPLISVGFFLIFPYFVPLLSDLGIDPVLFGYCKTALMSGCFVPVLIFASQVRLPTTSLVKCMSWVSWLSYSFYVWHLLIIRWMVSVYPDAGFLQTGLLSLAGTLILSDFTARHIEQPGIALGALIGQRFSKR